jgi:hypothetical protein
MVACLSAPPGSFMLAAYWPTGELKLSLPSSASLAIIVAATPFDTDAQRNTVSGVTFSRESASVSP